MHHKLDMHETIDLIINPFKYKCETCLTFIHLFQNIMVSAKCNLWVMDLAHSKWMIQLMCKCWQFKRCQNFSNMFKYKCEALNFCVCFNIYKKVQYATFK
jgi:hypothetical protein